MLVNLLPCRLYIKNCLSLLAKNIQLKINSKKVFVATLEDELKDVLDHVCVVDDAGLLQ
jgi:hypothetical protein